MALPLRNTAPVANADTTSTTDDKPVTISVLDNDSDADGDTLSYCQLYARQQRQQSHRAAITSFTHRTAGATGSDTFTYVVDDANGGKTTGTVSVTLSAATPVLTAKTDAFTVDATNTSSTLDVLANDTIPAGQTVTVEIVGNPLARYSLNPKQYD